MRALRHALTAIPTAHACAGDVALFSIEGNPQHVGILSDYNVTTLGLIHAYAPARAVVKHVLDISWQHRITGAFRII